MRVEITYPFDEFKFADGAWFRVDGEARIVAYVCDTYGEIDGYSFDAIRLNAGRGAMIEIDDSHVLFTPIMRGLEQCDDHIRECIDEEAREEHGPFRSLTEDRRADYRAAVL